MRRPLESMHLTFGAMLLSIVACTSDAAHGQAPPYLAPDAIDLTYVLPPPPTSAVALGRDLAAVRAAQVTRTAEQLERAQDDAEVSAFRFADVLGADFAADSVPITTGFLRKANRDLGAYITRAKDCWRRPRPFEVDDTIQPLADLLASAGARPNEPPPAAAPLSVDSPCSTAVVASRYSYSYPSGHSTFGAMTAILLAEMVPEKREQLYERGWEYGDMRIIGGVHFPSDVEAGRILASMVVALMMQNDRFQTDLAAARAELRGVLGLEDGAELPH
ncbi:MAG TPA: phosphatase PAP2 family protein [Gammaproteobacteria bacterium]|nr:phosphatase PAP2 family protein [Gammaproteobacteria bacterium]